MFMQLHYYSVNDVIRKLTINTDDISSFEPTYNETRKENLTRIYYRSAPEYIDVCENYALIHSVLAPLKKENPESKANENTGK